MRASFPIQKWPSSCCVLTGQQGQGSCLGALSFIRALLPFMGASRSGSDHLPKAHLLIPSHWVFVFQHVNFQGDTNIQILAPCAITSILISIIFCWAVNNFLSCELYRRYLGLLVEIKQKRKIVLWQPQMLGFFLWNGIYWYFRKYQIIEYVLGIWSKF